MKPPSLRARKASLLLGESKGKLSQRQALLRAGFSQKTADNPKMVGGWTKLLNRMLPDSLLTKRHQELLNKKEMTVLLGDDGEPYRVNQPETQAVSKGLDMAYKLRGKYPQDEPTQDGTTVLLSVMALIHGDAQPMVVTTPTHTETTPTETPESRPGSVLDAE